jgi:outer membrane protein assembly factor BamB
VAGPVVVPQAVVVVAAREVVALDPATGAPRWSVPRSEGSAGSAAISAGLVIHASGEEGSASLVARRITDGREQWRAYLDGPAPAGPIVAEDVVYVGTRSGVLHGFDVNTGAEGFRFDAPGAIEGSPAVGGERVVAAWEEAATRRATVRAVDVGSGLEERAPAWQLTSRPGGLPTAAVAVRGRSAFVAAGDGSLRAVDLETGVERWTVVLRDAVVSGQVPAAGPSPVVADRIHVSRLDPATGDEVWSHRLADFRALGEDEVNTLAASAPAVTGQAVVLGDATGVASAVDIVTGRRVWRADLGDGAVSAVAADGERLYLATLGPGGEVVALENDPQGRPLDEVSDTVLSPLRALLNFVLAFLVVSAVIVALFRYVLGGRRRSSEAAP